jgi:hypothetical protein
LLGRGPRYCDGALLGGGDAHQQQGTSEGTSEQPEKGS